MTLTPNLCYIGEAQYESLYEEEEMKWLLLAVLLCVSCGGDSSGTTYFYCSETVRTEMADWVLSCVEKANPKSDEEPEDWTAQCRWTAWELFCTENTKRSGIRTVNDPSVVWTK